MYRVQRQFSEASEPEGCGLDPNPARQVTHRQERTHGDTEEKAAQTRPPADQALFPPCHQRFAHSGFRLIKTPGPGLARGQGLGPQCVLPILQGVGTHAPAQESWCDEPVTRGTS